jgi:hypothetical protein
MTRYIRDLAAWSAFALFLLGGTRASGAAEDEWQSLPERQEIATIEGQQVTFVIQPQVRFSDGPDGIILDVRADAHLDELQAKAPQILHALAANKSNCETRWSFPELSPTTIQDGKLRIGGKVRVEQWVCAGSLETRLARETADFVIAMHPVRSPDTISMAAEIASFDLGQSMLEGVEDEVRRQLSSSLTEALDDDDAKLRFPAEVAVFEPQFTDARLINLAGGGDALHVEASTVVQAADLAKVISLISP